MVKWCAISVRSETRVTCEPSPCQLRFSRQSRPFRLSQGLAIVAEALMNNRARFNRGERGCDR